MAWRSSVSFYQQSASAEREVPTLTSLGSFDLSIAASVEACCRAINLTLAALVTVTLLAHKARLCTKCLCAELCGVERLTGENEGKRLSRSGRLCRVFN